MHTYTIIYNEQPVTQDSNNVLSQGGRQPETDGAKCC